MKIIKNSILIILFIIPFFTSAKQEENISYTNKYTEPTDMEINRINEAATRKVNGVATKKELEFLKEKGVKIKVEKGPGINLSQNNNYEQKDFAQSQKIVKVKNNFSKENNKNQKFNFSLWLGILNLILILFVLYKIKKN